MYVVLDESQLCVVPKQLPDDKVALAVVPVRELSFGVFLKNMLKISLTVCL